MRLFLFSGDEPQGAPSSYIPTFGAVGTALDIYRLVGIESVDNHPGLWAFTDVNSLAALGRLVDGPIQSAGDISAAESALRAILLNEHVETFIPCIKGGLDSGTRGYIRFDEGLRNDASFECLGVVPTASDLLCAVDFVHIEDGAVTRSGVTNSPFVGKKIDHLRAEEFESLQRATAELAYSLATDVAAGTYFSTESLSGPLNGGMNQFVDSMYRRISNQWNQFAQPELVLTGALRLPPLLAIVLHRASDRSDIPRVLRELRTELHSVRGELLRLNQMLDSIDTQAEIMAQVDRANESFDAVVAEARLTAVQRRSRAFFSIFKFLRPSLSLLSITTEPYSIDPDRLRQLWTTANAAVLANSRLVTRNVAAAKMADLLRVDSIRRLLTDNLSEAELKLIKMG